MSAARIVLRSCAARLSGSPLAIAVLLTSLAACSLLLGCGGGGTDPDERMSAAPPDCVAAPAACQ